jgi:pyruvate dehydrogenase E2 component (dihydrolipoamide acetyltransferase)
MSANISEAKPAAPEATAAVTPPIPKRITNAQTVCNERNEKKKLCNGHLKQLKTAGEASEVHLRGDDVLFKCQICGTLYMGPPLGHVRDPEKQSRFVEAELSALLQAAGGTLPVIKKNEKGVYVIVEPEGEHAHAAPAAKPAAAPVAAPAAVPAKPTPAAAQATVVAEKSMTPPAGPKPAAEPDRQLNRRSTYAGVVDTGPVAGETQEQKIARLQKVVAGAKQRSEEGGAEPAAAVIVIDSSAAADAHRPAAEAQAETGAASAAPLSAAAANASPVAGAETPAELAPDKVAAATTPTSTTSHTSSGEVDRTLMKRSTYAGVVDTGPVPGETQEQKIERLTKLAAAAKQRADEGG